MLQRPRRIKYDICVLICQEIKKMSPEYFERIFRCVISSEDCQAQVDELKLQNEYLTRMLEYEKKETNWYKDELKRLEILLREKA